MRRQQAHVVRRRAARADRTDGEATAIRARMLRRVEQRDRDDVRERRDRALDCRIRGRGEPVLNGSKEPSAHMQRQSRSQDDCDRCNRAPGHKNRAQASGLPRDQWSGLKLAALPFEPPFQTIGAVAAAARPGLFAVEITAPAACVGVLHLKQLEILLPVRALFGQRRGTETDFHPLDPAVPELPRVRHVAKVFVAGNRPGSERPIVDGALQ